jgi:hypothetical protein
MSNVMSAASRATSLAWLTAISTFLLMFERRAIIDPVPDESHPPAIRSS